MSFVTTNKITDARNRFDLLSNELRELSPQAALKRGYSFIVQNRKLLHSIQKVNKGDKIDVLLSDGKLKAEVKAIEKD